MVWKEYFNVVPFSQQRHDERTAVLAATTANVSGKITKKPVDVQLFMPDYWDERNLDKQSEKRQVEAEKEFVNSLLASGLGTISNATGNT